MEELKDAKALIIIVNAGFADLAVDLALNVGAGGATIINSRGVGSIHKSIMGISVDTEKELVLTIVNAETAAKVISEIQRKAGFTSPANGICFTLPVERLVL